MSRLVSVIIPCYNHGLHLPCAVNSIQAQTLSEWECIIVDDGSTDDTPTIARQFRDARVRYVYQANAGLSAARNTGVREAQGSYLVFLDADDDLKPIFLQTCRDVLEHDPTLSGVYTLNQFIDERSNVLPQLGGTIVARDRFRSRNLEGGFFAVHAAMVRADIVREVGLFDTQLTSEEDWDLWIRIADRFAMQGIAQPLARYRVYPGSMSTNALRMHTNRITVLTKYFGAPIGASSDWSEDKRRAYGFAFRATALSLLQQNQPEEVSVYLSQAVRWWPALLERVDTFYELIVGNQSSGYRGEASRINLERNGCDTLLWLDEFCAQTPLPRSLCQYAHGNFHLALGMLYDQAGDWAAARHQLRQAIKAYPRLIASYPTIRRLLKLYIRPEWVRVLRRAPRV